MVNSISRKTISFINRLRGKFAHNTAVSSPVAQEMAGVISTCPKLERTAGGYFPNNTGAALKAESDRIVNKIAANLPAKSKSDIESKISKLQAQLNFCDKYDLDWDPNGLAARRYQDISDEIKRLKQQL